MAMDKIFDFDNQEYVSEVVVFREFMAKAVESRDNLERCGLKMGYSDNWKDDLVSSLRRLNMSNDGIGEVMHQLVTNVIKEFRHPTKQYNFDKDDGRGRLAVSKKTPLMSVKLLLAENDKRRNPRYKSVVLRSMKYDRFDPTVISRCCRKPKTNASIANHASSNTAQDFNNEHEAGIEEIAPSNEGVADLELDGKSTADYQFLHHDDRFAYPSYVHLPRSQAEDAIPIYNPYEDLLQTESACTMPCTDQNNSDFSNQPLFSTLLSPINPQSSWTDPMCDQWSPNPSAAECWLHRPPLPYFSNARNTDDNTLMPTSSPFMLFPTAAVLNSTINNGIYVNNAEVCPFTTDLHEPWRHSVTVPHYLFPYRSENPAAWYRQSVGGLFPIPLLSDFQVGDYRNNNQNPYLFNQPLQQLQMFPQENLCTREEAPYEGLSCDPATDSLPTIERSPSIEENSTECSNLNDIVVQVSIHVGYPRPLEKEELRLGRLLKVVDRFLVLGSNTLKELKDSIDCPADYYVLDDVSQRFLMDQDLCKYRYPSSFFFIHDTFYIDLEPKGSQDITEKIRTWATERGLGGTKVADMNTTKLIDLKCRLGAPYLYVHIGLCEHLISFNDIALRDDIHPTGPYPLPFYELNTRRISCAGCKMATSEWVVWNHEGTPVPVQYFCESCYNDLNFDVFGERTFNFKAAPLYDRHNRKADRP